MSSRSVGLPLRLPLRSAAAREPRSWTCVDPRPLRHSSEAVPGGGQARAPGGARAGGEEIEQLAADRLRNVAAVLIAAADTYLEQVPEAMSPAERARLDAATQLVWRACRIVRAAPTSRQGR